MDRKSYSSLQIKVREEKENKSAEADSFRGLDACEKNYKQRMWTFMQNSVGKKIPQLITEANVQFPYVTTSVSNEKQVSSIRGSNVCTATFSYLLFPLSSVDCSSDGNQISHKVAKECCRKIGEWVIF